MPIDKVASTPGNPVFGLSPESFKDRYWVRSRPWIVDGPALPPLTRNPNLKYVYNTILANVRDAKGNYKAGPTGLMTELYQPGGLLYKRPAAR